MSAATAQDLYNQGWRINNLYSIRNKAGKRIPFKLNWAQQMFFENVWYNNVILKARQFGFSTLIDLLGLDNCVFSNDYAAQITAHDLDSAEDLFERNVKFTYESLPEGIKNTVGATRDAAKLLRFTNGSSIRVTTSGRSGALQFMHVSEFGKICARYPQKAREIITGSLEAVGMGNIVVIESTAEGNEGAFFDICQDAKLLADGSKKLTKQDFRFHFFAWWQHPDYKLNPDGVIITPELQKYFAELAKTHSIKPDKWQKAWYAKKHSRLGDDMKREYPSTPEEAFEASVEGAYYGELIAQAYREGRITRVPFVSGVPINTFWDLGVDDYTCIWLHQYIDREHRFIGYIEDQGYALQHYANELWDWRKRGAVFGTHHMPHDARNRSLQTGISLEDQAIKLGIAPTKIVQTPSLMSGIQQVRSILPTCLFDEEQCATGIKRLQNYKKEWSERLAAYIDKPRHDESSHGADAFRMFAQGYSPESAGLIEQYEPELVEDY